MKLKNEKLKIAMMKLKEASVQKVRLTFVLGTLLNRNVHSKFSIKAVLCHHCFTRECVITTCVCVYITFVYVGVC